MKRVALLILALSLTAASCNNQDVSEYDTLPQIQNPNPQAPVIPKNLGLKCNSNYSGCVPIASDVDCAGGSGNGPEYVSGPIQVIGSDIYDLDRDNDGIACE